MGSFFVGKYVEEEDDDHHIYISITYMNHGIYIW